MYLRSTFWVHPDHHWIPVFLVGMAWGQSNCDDLEIEHIWYAAFIPTAVEVLVTNNGAVGLTAPEFNFVNTDLDTLAREPFDFFAMPIGEQTHTMHLLPGMSMPANPFNGELVLHYNHISGPGTCIFPMNSEQLCPPLRCTELYLQIIPMDTLVTTLITWMVMDEADSTVAFGEAFMDPIQQPIGMDTICLPPGLYNLHLLQSPFGNGGPFKCILFRDPIVNQLPQIFYSGVGEAVLPFAYYAACADAVNAIDEVIVPSLIWNVHNDLLSVKDPRGIGVGELLVMDTRGSIIHSSTINSDQVTIDLHNQARGTYVIVREFNSQRTVHRFVLH